MIFQYNIKTANMEKCSSYTAKGTRCTKNGYHDGLCATHRNALNKSGPNRYALSQIQYKWKGERARISDVYKLAIMATDIPQEKQRLRVERSERLAASNRVYMTEQADLLTTQREEIARTGINPDAEADARRVENLRVLNAQRNERQAARLAEGQRVENIMGNLDHRIGALREFLDDLGDDVDGPAWVDVRQPERRLQVFAHDPQNVHTTEAVNQTKEIIAKIRMISVPEDYRWNMSVTSKTPGEIIADCKLSVHASCQMLTQYSNDVAVYDIEAGIYGKVLDSVWQFVKNSSDKNDLCRILKQEMEDNIGMCAQGNLTRICNIVAGYMDGVGQQESKSEKLGRLFAELAKMEDRTIREDSAKDILVDNHVPYEEWGAWLEAVMAD